MEHYERHCHKMNRLSLFDNLLEKPAIGEPSLDFLSAPAPSELFSLPPHALPDGYHQCRQWSYFYTRIQGLSFLDRLVRIIMKVMLDQLQTHLSPFVKSTIKFKYLHSIQTNAMYNTYIQTECMEIFVRYQRMHRLISRIKRAWVYRRASLQMTMDLFMNDLDPAHKYTMDLYHRGARYLFSLADLSRIWMSALTHSSAFFSVPLAVKNPYTNLPFTKSELYTIYLKMLDVRFRIPRFIQYFFECEFNVYVFKRNHESELSAFILREYARNSSSHLITRDIHMMIRAYDRKRRLVIHPDFPEDVLSSAFRPYLELYYLSMHAFEPAQRLYFRRDLSNKMNGFIAMNPLFGRKILKASSSWSDMTWHFVTDIRRFPKPDLGEYFQNHLYDENEYNRFLYVGNPSYHEETPTPSPAHTPPGSPPRQTPTFRESIYALIRASESMPVVWTDDNEGSVTENADEPGQEMNDEDNDEETHRVIQEDDYEGEGSSESEFDDEIDEDDYDP
jgi:hypothetical protein